jgi:molybdate transport system regulatory protein
VTAATCQIRILFSDPLNLGPGKVRLLEAIREAGSISGAARQLHISYRRAWLMADGLNRVFPRPLIDTAAGGVRGGGAQLTELGETVLDCYRRMETKAARAVSKEAEILLALAR